MHSYAGIRTVFAIWASAIALPAASTSNLARCQRAVAARPIAMFNLRPALSLGDQPGGIVRHRRCDRTSLPGERQIRPGSGAKNWLALGPRAIMDANRLSTSMSEARLCK